MAGARFRYRARDAAGQARQGIVEAADLAGAVQALQQRLLTPIEVTPADAVPAAAVPGRSAQGGMVATTERIVLLQELATLLEAGVSVAEALPSMADAYAAQPSGAALAALRDAVNAGRPLADSLRQATRLGLPPYALALIEAGEASGSLARAMKEAADQLEHDRRIAEEMRNALIYPSVLVVVGTLVILAIFIGVVPRFANLIDNPRADIPALSRQVISAAVYVRQHGLAFALSVIGVLASLVGVFSGAEGRRRLMRVAVAVPALRRWLIEADIGRWASVLSALLGNRVPVIRALQLSAAAVRVDAMAADVARLAGELERGRTLADALRELSWFPASRVNLVRVGERSGELPRTLATLGEMHTGAARSRQRRLLALIEPVAILLIGAVVGFVMVAVMSAITSVNSIAL
ncbi:MAG: type II secretion system F family protein [Rubrivivax sp.]|nr:type II secretion system F family protein [Rubrivivax sp.]